MAFSRTEFEKIIRIKTIQRIRKFEKMGKGNNIMAEKQMLQKLEKKIKDRKLNA